MTTVSGPRLGGGYGGHVNSRAPGVSSPRRRRRRPIVCTSPRCAPNTKAAKSPARYWISSASRVAGASGRAGLNSLDSAPASTGASSTCVRCRLAAVPDSPAWPPWFSSSVSSRAMSSACSATEPGSMARICATSVRPERNTRRRWASLKALRDTAPESMSCWRHAISAASRGSSPASMCWGSGIARTPCPDGAGCRGARLR